MQYVCIRTVNFMNILFGEKLMLRSHGSVGRSVARPQRYGDDSSRAEGGSVWVGARKERRFGRGVLVNGKLNQNKNRKMWANYVAVMAQLCIS